MESVLAGAIVAVVTSFATAYFSSRFYTRQVKADLKKELQKEFESRFNERKWEIYLEFADIVRQMTQLSKLPKEKRRQSELVNKLVEFVAKLWLVGSDEVINTYAEWKQIIQDAQKIQESSPEVVFKVMEIIIAMRKDLGYETSRVTREILLSTFIQEPSIIENEGQS